MHIGLFLPCFIDAFLPEVGVATLELLERFGHEVVYPRDQTCCGQPMADNDCNTDAVATEALFVRNFSDWDYGVAPEGSCVHPSVTAVICSTASKLSRTWDAARAHAARADTAIFYSISNCQNGLRDVTFGNNNSDIAAPPTFASNGGWRDQVQSETVRAVLMHLCATYLTRRPSPGIRIDPVARFHLGNAARPERINWLGNDAPRAIKESFGVMVNYLYGHDTIEDNDEAFVRDGTIVRSRDVDILLETNPHDGRPRHNADWGATGGRHKSIPSPDVDCSAAHVAQSDALIHPCHNGE